MLPFGKTLTCLSNSLFLLSSFYFIFVVSIKWEIKSLFLSKKRKEEDTKHKFSIPSLACIKEAISTLNLSSSSLKFNCLDLVYCSVTCKLTTTTITSNSSFNNDNLVLVVVSYGGKTTTFTCVLLFV